MNGVDVLKLLSRMAADTRERRDYMYAKTKKDDESRSADNDVSEFLQFSFMQLNTP